MFNDFAPVLENKMKSHHTRPARTWLQRSQSHLKTGGHGSGF